MLINELTLPVEEGAYDPHIFKAVFMAGSPGAGKSTIANKLFTGTGLKTLNIDTFYHLYRTLGKQSDYERFQDLYKAQEKNFLEGRLGIIVDGTARDPERMARAKANLEGLGYDCAMVFVNTSLDVSMSRVMHRMSRPGKDFGRKVDPEYVQDVWEKTQKGMGKLQSLFQGNFYIVDNNRGQPKIDFVQRSIDRWLEEKPHKPAAREWMQQQLAFKSAAEKKRPQQDDAAPAPQSGTPPKSST